MEAAKTLLAAVHAAFCGADPLNRNLSIPRFLKSKNLAFAALRGWCSAIVLTMSAGVWAQELEPRAYSASPVGTNFVVVGFARSSGSVLSDPTLPISDVHATLHIPTVGLGRTFGFFGRQALATFALPYIWGEVTGNVGEQKRAVTRSGLADLRMKFAVNLRGNPAMSPAEFAKRSHRSVLIGASLMVIAPTGQYDPSKLVNVGTNRWAFKPEGGISFPIKKVDLELYAGVWLFTGNSRFFPGTYLREQNAVATVQGHISYSFRPRLWVAGDATWYAGGATSINGGAASGEQNNSRAGLTLSVPIAKNQSFKFAYSSGTTSRHGSNFTTLGVTFQSVWFDKHGKKKR